MANSKRPKSTIRVEKGDWTHIHRFEFVNIPLLLKRWCVRRHTGIYMYVQSKNKQELPKKWINWMIQEKKS